MFNNNSEKASSNASYGDFWSGFKTTPSLQVSLTVVYAITFIIAFLGNISVVHIIKQRRTKNAVSILIANMAVSDLFTALFTMPYTVFYLYEYLRWFGGLAGVITCKIVHFIIGTTIATSIMALLAISVERYIAVVKPLLYPTFIKKPVVLSAAIWFSSAVYFSVYPYTYKIYEFPNGDAICYLDWSGTLLGSDLSPKIFYSTMFSVLYVIPLSLIALMSGLIIKRLKQNKAAFDGKRCTHAQKEHNAVVRLLRVIVTLFALCWLPIHILHFLIYYFEEIYIALSPSVVLFLFWVSHANSALNPCIIIMMSASFRQSFRELRFGERRDKYPLQPKVKQVLFQVQLNEVKFTNRIH